MTQDAGEPDIGVGVGIGIGIEEKKEFHAKPPSSKGAKWLRVLSSVAPWRCVSARVFLFHAETRRARRTRPENLRLSATSADFLWT
jgi:hypothetical protein